MKDVIIIVKSVYIHIPFCQQICHYCDFNKVFIHNQPVDDYLLALRTEITTNMQNYTGQIETIFVGGGTPTALTPLQLERLLEMIKLQLLPGAQPNVEFTFEANPGEVSKQKLKLLHDYGVNRLSFGVQAFQDHLLEKIGRTHRVKDVFETVTWAKEVGFSNLNIDLMYGLPSQTIQDVKQSLAAALSLDIPHFSAYSLQVEPKTVFYNLMQKGKLKLPAQEIEADMYETIIEEMNTSGRQRYEISNFAIPGYESRHNLTYWNNEEYFGFGAGAHGYVRGNRMSNAGPLKSYMARVAETGTGGQHVHAVLDHEAMEEEMFLGLRKVAGVNKAHFKQKFGITPSEVFHHQIEIQKQKGLMTETSEHLRLTTTGFLLGNEVFQAFIG